MDVGKASMDEDAAEQENEEERQRAEELGREARQKAEGKRQFKVKNMNAADGRPSEGSLKKLDGSVKKNSTFVKKLRTLTEQQRSQLTSDFKALNLSKYIQEAATSIAEAKLKVGDVGCAVHLCSLLHLSYADFTGQLLEQLQRVYSVSGGNLKVEDKTGVVTKYRVGLRLLAELVLGGIVEEDIGTTLLLEMLSAITRSDPKAHGYLSVVLSFARHCAEDVAGISPRKHRLLATKYGIAPPKSELLPEAKQEEFREVLRSYFSALRQHMSRQHKAMHQRERRDHHTLQAKGELSEEKQTQNEAAQKAYDKLLTNTSTLAEILDEDMPELPPYQAPQDDSDITIELQIPVSLSEGAEVGPQCLWEDEDTRSFYEGITDIKPFVPAILYEKRKKTDSESSDSAQTGETPTGEGETPTGEGESPTAEGDETDEEKVLEQVIKDTEEISLDNEDEEEGGVAPSEEREEGEGAGSGEGVEGVNPAALRMDEFIQRLPNLMNRKLVDDYAVEFCMEMNSKLHRRRLAKALFSVDRNRMDLIPFYARLVATLHPCLVDVAPLLVELLLREFRWQVRKKDQEHIYSKIKNVRFIAELTKFGLCPKPEAMKCITILLHDFTHHNLEMACVFIEHCGRFLLRSPDSHLRAKALLEIMLRKKKIQHLDGRQMSLVENALYYANPPDVSHVAHVRRPPLEEYVIKLLHKDLNKLNTEKILRQIRKIPWNDPEVMQCAVGYLAQIWKPRYSSIHCMANLLAGLKPYQEEAVMRVVDSVLEDIRLGLEANIPKFNQRRVAGVKFLGELYNYQLVESTVIFRMLYLLMTFGASPDGSASPLDPFDSYFRVRLICILLDTCGQYFDRGSSKKSLDTFLVFFQCYLFSKRQPLPLEVDHLVADTLEVLRPELLLCSSAIEASEAAMLLEKKFKDKMGDDGEGGEGGEESEEEEEEEEGKRGGRSEDGEDGEEGENEEEQMEGLSQPDNTFEVDPVMKTATSFERSEEDDAFKAAFDKLMSEDQQTRRQEAIKVPTMDTAVPILLQAGGSKTAAAAVPMATSEEGGGAQKIRFKVMSKKGNKQHLKELDIPVDSELALGLRGTQQALAVEHKEMKKLVLDYERRQEEEAYQAMVADLQKIGSKKQEQPHKQPPVPASFLSSSSQQRHHHHPSSSSSSSSSSSPRQHSSRPNYRGGGAGGGGGARGRHSQPRQRYHSDQQTNRQD